MWDPPFSGPTHSGRLNDARLRLDSAFSLLELLVGVLFLIVVGGLVTSFLVSGHKAGRVGMSVVKGQEVGVYFLRFLQKELVSATAVELPLPGRTSVNWFVYVDGSGQKYVMYLDSTHSVKLRAVWSGEPPVTVIPSPSRGEPFVDSFEIKNRDGRSVDVCVRLWRPAVGTMKERSLGELVDTITLRGR